MIPRSLLRRRTLDRRTFLRRTGAAALAAGIMPWQLGCASSGEEPAAPGPPPPLDPHWLHGARIAGVPLWLGIEGFELAAAMDQAQKEGVSVCEVDADLSFYQTEAEFEAHVTLLDQVGREAHARGMRAVVYYPALEVLTPGADKAATRTMARDHPDWVQVDVLGQKSVFIGGDGRVFWVPPDTESAWLCPLTGWADQYLHRIGRLATTSLDGVWPDVPLLSDIAATWPCTEAACRARFLADTGLSIQMSPTWPDWSDPAFRRWVAWRHDIVWEFQQRILTAARAVREDFVVIVETVTMDYNGCTVQGLDGASHEGGELLRVWEVDGVSDQTGMREATAADWLSMAAMMKHGRGCMGDAPSWTFCYGRKADDAEHVAGLAVATNNAPFETKIPDMLTSVGEAYRQRIFSYVKEIGELYRTKSAARVALVYCSASRDVVDQNAGVGLYDSLNAEDELWWSTEPIDRATALPYVSDYRGLCALLFHLKEPFDVLIAPRLTATTLERYDVVLLPSAAAIGEGHIEALAVWVEAGGTLITTGEGLGRYDERLAERDDALLQSRLSFTPSPGWIETAAGSGRVLATSERIGSSYLAGDPAGRAAVAEAIAVARTPLVTVTGPDGVLADVRRGDDGRIWVALANLEGLGVALAPRQRFAPAPAATTVTLHAPAETATLFEPGEGPRSLPLTEIEGGVTVSVSVSASAVIVLA